VDWHLPMKVRRTIGAALVGVAYAGLLTGGFASCGTTDATPLDATLDSNPTTDSRPMPPKDGGMDTGSSRDGAPVTVEVPYPGEWNKLEGIAADCALRMAADPAKSFSPFSWKPCASGRVGCETFLPDWSPSTRFSFAQSHLGGAFEDARGVHLAFFRSDSGPHRLSMVYQLHGEAELALYGHDKSDNSCTPLKISSTPFGLGAIVMHGFKQSPSEVYALWAPTTAPTALSVENITTKLGSRYLVQGMLRGDDGLALEQTAGGLAIHVGLFRISDRAVVPGVQEYGTEGFRPIPAPGGYFTSLQTNPPVLAFMPKEGGPHRVVVRPMPGHRVLAVDLDRKNGNALAWTEYEEATERTTLYTSPFATSEAGIVRRIVARLPSPYAGVFNAGVYLTRGSYAAFRLVRISDGLGWDIPSEPEFAALDGLWVNDDFAWQWASSVREGSPGFPVQGAIVRVARAGLGAPTVPSGL